MNILSPQKSETTLKIWARLKYTFERGQSEYRNLISTTALETARAEKMGDSGVELEIKGKREMVLLEREWFGS